MALGIHTIVDRNEVASSNAAYALRRHNDIGSIEIGKQADLVLFDVPTHEFLPYQFGVNHVLKVIKKGEVVVDFE